jgi:hypothetical protein
MLEKGCVILNWFRVGFSGNNSFVKVRNLFYRLNEYDWIRPVGYLVEIFRMWSYK